MIRFVLGLAAFAVRVLAGLIRSGFHHPAAALVLLVLAVAAVLFYRRMLSGRAQVRRRVRALRWRIRLRLRPGAGFASLAELWFRWGRLAALSHGRRVRPDMGFWVRFFSPTSDYAVRLGRAQYGRRVYTRGEDQTLVRLPIVTGV